MMSRTGAVALVVLGLTLAFVALAVGEPAVTAGDAALAVLGVVLAAVGMHRDARATAGRLRPLH